jgi:hypothetical protein
LQVGARSEWRIRCTIQVWITVRRLGLQLTLVTPSTGIATGFAALLALRIAQPIRLGIQQRVQCLLHATPDNAVQVILYPLIVNRDDIA